MANTIYDEYLMDKVVSDLTIYSPHCPPQLYNMSALQKSMRSVARLCKQSARHDSFISLGLLHCDSATNKQPHHKLLSKNLQSSSTHQFCNNSDSRPRKTSRGGMIEGSNVKGGNFQDINLDTLVAESIKEEDRGPRNNEMDGDEDEIFVSQSGKMLLFPWRPVNARKGGSSEEKGVKTKDKTKYPSVTGILQKTMSPDSAMALLRWERFMIKKMGIPAFQKLKKEMFSEGSKLHENIGHVLLHKPEDLVIEKGIEGYWKSIKEQLPELSSNSPIIECHTKHPYLGYHGFADCITEYRGEPCLVEFKTSRKPKKTLSKCFDNPLQVAAYLGALNFDPRYQLQINQALLVITYKDGSPADLHLMTPDLCDLYWKKWLRRLQEYREIEGRQAAA